MRFNMLKTVRNLFDSLLPFFYIPTAPHKFLRWAIRRKCGHATMGENYAVVTTSSRRKWLNMNGRVTARYLIDLGAESQPRPFPSTVENATAGRNSRDTRRDRLRSAGDASRGIGMRSSEDHNPSMSSAPGLSWSADALLFARRYSSNTDHVDNSSIPFEWKIIENVILSC